MNLYAEQEHQKSVFWQNRHDGGRELPNFALDLTNIGAAYSVPWPLYLLPLFAAQRSVGQKWGEPQIVDTSEFARSTPLTLARRLSDLRPLVQ